MDSTNPGLSSIGRALFLVRSPDMLDAGAWALLRDGTEYEAYITDRDWLRHYRSRMVDLRPGDYLDAVYEEHYFFDAAGNIVCTKMQIAHVHGVRGPQALMQNEVRGGPGKDRFSAAESCIDQIDQRTSEN